MIRRYEEQHQQYDFIPMVYTEFVRKHEEGIRSVNVNVNGIFAVSLNMALSMFILEKHFFFVVSAIIFSDRNEFTANSHITLTSMLFVKIPWAQTRVHVKLDIQEMGNNVAVRTVSKKYGNMHFETHTTVFQQCGLKHTQFSSYQSACDDSEDYSDKPASKLSILNLERREPRKKARASGYGQEKGGKCGIVSLFVLLLSCFLLFFGSAALFPLQQSAKQTVMQVQLQSFLSDALHNNNNNNNFICTPSCYMIQKVAKLWRDYRLPIIAIEGKKDRAALLRLLINDYIKGSGTIVGHVRHLSWPLTSPLYEQKRILSWYDGIQRRTLSHSNQHVNTASAFREQREFCLLLVCFFITTIVPTRTCSTAVLST